MREVAISSRRIAIPLMTAALLAACGGGGGRNVAPGAPNTGVTSTASGTGSLTLTIAIPRLSATAGKRRASYISAQTASIAITVTQGSTIVLAEAVPLTPATNPNCTIAGNTTTCAIVIGLAAGAYTGTFATYDGPVVASAATGNLLSQGQSVPLTVTAGLTNTIAATLDGVPASIAIAPASGSTISGTQAGGFTVPYTAQGLTIDALDADGNIILGAGAPTFTAGVTAPQFAVTQPGVTPNQITLAATAGGTGTLTITAAPPDGGFSCSASGVVCTATASVATPPHTLYEAATTGLSIYTSLDNVTWTLSSTNTNGITQPRSITMAPNGDLLIQNISFGSGWPPTISASLLIFAPPYTGTPTSVALPSTQIVGAAMAPNGSLLVANGTALYSIAPPYSGSPTLVYTFSGLPSAMIADGSGNVFTSLTYSPYITQFLTSPYSTATTISTSHTGGYLAVRASDGTLAIGSNNTLPRLIFSVPTPYATSTETTVFSTNSGLYGIAFDTQGNLWAGVGSTVLEFTAPLSSSQSPAHSVSITAQSLAADSSGHMLVLPQNGTTISIVDQTGTIVGTIPVANGQAQLLYVK